MQQFRRTLEVIAAHSQLYYFCAERPTFNCRFGTRRKAMTPNTATSCHYLHGPKLILKDWNLKTIRQILKQRAVNIKGLFYCRFSKTETFCCYNSKVKTIYCSLDAWRREDDPTPSAFPYVTISSH